jgi:hypothetical protein
MPNIIDSKVIISDAFCVIAPILFFVLGEGRRGGFDNKTKINDKYLVVPDGIQLRYPEYSVIDLRINSFTTWNFHNKKSPMTLAHSGYFYTGNLKTPPPPPLVSTNLFMRIY